MRIQQTTEGAQELGFSNLAEMWLSTYEMSPAAMDGSALIAYFEPLMAWLGAQNASRQCGW